MSTSLLEPNQATGTKKCPFCAEQIQAEAIKCRYCGEFLRERTGQGISSPALGSRSPILPEARAPWYFSTSTLLIAVLSLGPLALPLVWLNPRYKGLTRLLITVAILVLTFVLCQLMLNTYRNLMDQVRALGLN